MKTGSDLSTNKRVVAGKLSKILDKKGVYTVVTKSENYLAVSQEMIRLLNKKFPGIYVTLSKQHCSVVERLKSEKIDTSRILFIDNSEEGNGCGADNAIFIGKNKSLTALSLALSPAAKQKSMKFIFFDSVTTLLVYHKLEEIERFIHYFVNKSKDQGILVVLMAVNEGKTRKLIPILSQFCDGLITV
ncbi:MAG: hypothetical protein Q8Q01_01110 [archaeon]|nr:hypothetical protein [archaeon]